MDHGKIVTQGSPQSLLSSHFGGVLIRIPIDGTPSSVPDGAVVSSGHLEIETNDVEEEVRRLLEHGISLTGLSVESANLDDLFLKTTGSSLRE